MFIISRPPSVLLYYYRKLIQRSSLLSMYPYRLAIQLLSHACACFECISSAIYLDFQPIRARIHRENERKRCRGGRGSCKYIYTNCTVPSEADVTCSRCGVLRAASEGARRTDTNRERERADDGDRQMNERNPGSGGHTNRGSV